jgi:hypothetical protein
MADRPLSSNPPPDDMHWGVSYLREDLQDLRQEIRGLHERIERSEARTAGQFRWTYSLILLSWLSLVGIVLPLHFRP